MCGVLAVIMCIFILGPIAMIIVTYRVGRNWIYNIPNDYSDFEGIYPMFITFGFLVAVIVVLSTI